MRVKIFIICFFALQISTKGQMESKSKFSKAIEDNSYLIEEAYNQEDGIVQHISNGYRTQKPTKDFGYSFTQEWPVFIQKHQFSYTIGYSWLNSSAVNGISDFQLNYRFQLTGHDDFLTLSPRFSLILPTGDEQKGLGSGVLGYQVNIPISKRLSNGLACHANFGYTLLPGVKSTDINGDEVKNTNSNINLGGSLIWLATERLNIMLEGVHYILRSANSSNKMETSQQTIISPGFRFAMDVKSLQIVPGFAVPITFQDSESNAGLFFYLSFEHPF